MSLNKKTDSLKKDSKRNLARGLFLWFFNAQLKTLTHLWVFMTK